MIPITIYYLMSLTIYFFVGFITKNPSRFRHSDHNTSG